LSADVTAGVRQTFTVAGNLALALATFVGFLPLGPDKSVEVVLVDELVEAELHQALTKLLVVVDGVLLQGVDEQGGEEFIRSTVQILVDVEELHVLVSTSLERLAMGPVNTMLAQNRAHHRHEVVFGKEAER
jgi:hypothetical protein